MNITIRSATPRDASAICDIYNHYVLETRVTFEERPVAVEEMQRRISENRSAALAEPSIENSPGALTGLPWLAAEEGRRVVGYAYATKWRPRSAYRFSVESTVYVDKDCPGRGVGSRLYEALLRELRDRNLHSVLGGIALPNPASVALHEKFGFHQVAHFRQVGWKLGAWVDVGYWQLLLEQP